MTTEPESADDALARTHAARTRPTPRRDAERAFEVEMLILGMTVEASSYSEPREDVPLEFLQARVGARLTVALIGWLTRRHPRVTRSDREGPSAWTEAPLGAALTAATADDLARLGATDSPTDDPACLAAFDGLGTAYPDRVRLIAQARARFEDGWISLLDSELEQRRRTALLNTVVAQRDIDAWKAGER